MAVQGAHTATLLAGCENAKPKWSNKFSDVQSHTTHTLSTSFVHCIVIGDWGMGILGMDGAFDLT